MNYETNNDLTDIQTPSGIRPEYIVAGIFAVAILLLIIWPRGGSGGPSAGAGAATAIQASGLSVAEMAAMLKG
jgi:hypothetical protein